MTTRKRNSTSSPTRTAVSISSSEYGHPDSQSDVISTFCSILVNGLIRLIFSCPCLFSPPPLTPPKKIPMWPPPSNSSRHRRVFFLRHVVCLVADNDHEPFQHQQRTNDTGSKLTTATNGGKGVFALPHPRDHALALRPRRQQHAVQPLRHLPPPPRSPPSGPPFLGQVSETKPPQDGRKALVIGLLDSKPASPPAAATKAAAAGRAAAAIAESSRTAAAILSPPVGHAAATAPATIHHDRPGASSTGRPCSPARRSVPVPARLLDRTNPSFSFFFFGNHFLMSPPFFSLLPPP